jgi:hypothetical protein
MRRRVLDRIIRGSSRIWRWRRLVQVAKGVQVKIVKVEAERVLDCSTSAGVHRKKSAHVKLERSGKIRWTYFWIAKRTRTKRRDAEVNAIAKESETSLLTLSRSAG